MSGNGRREEPTHDVMSGKSGSEIFYVEWRGKGVPIVLLHGLGGNAYWWKPLAEELEGRRIIALDLPGHGSSPGLDEWDLVKTAELVHGAVKDLTGEPAIWGGQSWGGKMATIIAGLFPEDAAGLLLMDPAPAHGIPLPPEAFIQARHGLELGQWPTLDDAVNAVKGMPQYRNWSDDLKAAFEHGLEQNVDGSRSAKLSRDVALAIAQATIATDHSDIIGRVKCPTLLIVASESTPWQQRTNIVALPEARVETIDGNHWIHVDQTQACAKAIRSWLTEQESSGKVATPA